MVLVHIAFFIMALCFTRIYMGDSYEYIYEAVNLKNLNFLYSGNPALPISPEYMTQRQPVYPLFLLGVYLFSINNWIVLLLQNAISMFNILYIRQAFLKIGYQKKWDWLLLLLTLAYPAQFINANTIAPDILLQTCTLLYFGNFIALVQKKEFKYIIYMSLALVMGMFIKPVLYPFTLVHVFVVVITAAYLKLKLQRPVLLALTPLLFVIMYNYWNFTRTGKFHFSSNQSFNAIFYYYSYFSAKEGADSAGRWLAKERSNIASIPDFNERYDYANERGIALLKENFVPYMAFHLKNTCRIFIEPGKGEIDLFTGKLSYGRLFSKERTGFAATWKDKGINGMGSYIKNNPSLAFVIIIFLFNCIRLVGMYLFFRSKEIHWLVRLFILGYLVYFALAAGPIANTRYFLPVSMIAVGCATIGISKKILKTSS